MTSLPPRLASSALLAVVLACAHAPAAHPLPPVVWPADPAAARVKLVAIFPDGTALPPQRPAWRRLLDAIAGADRADRPESWVARPFGVAASGEGTYFVADPDAPAVIRVARGGVATRLGCRGRDWLAPMAAAIAPDGALWVADGAAGELVRIDADGRCRAVGKGGLVRPTGLAVTAERVYVTDPATHEVVVLGTATGAVIARWGGLGSGDGQLHSPTALALTPAGDVLVVDALNFRVARFSVDGAWLGAFGEASGQGAGFARPKAVALDAAGRVYVTDAQRDAILVYAPHGAFEVALGAEGTEPGALLMPAGIAVAGRRVYVADSLNRRVQVFEMIGEAP